MALPIGAVAVTLTVEDIEQVVLNIAQRQAVKYTTVKRVLGSVYTDELLDALDRLMAKGLITRVRLGRATHYRLSEHV